MCIYIYPQLFKISKASFKYQSKSQFVGKNGLFSTRSQLRTEPLQQEPGESKVNLLNHTRMRNKYYAKPLHVNSKLHCQRSYLGIKEVGKSKFETKMKSKIKFKSNDIHLTLQLVETPAITVSSSSGFLGHAHRHGNHITYIQTTCCI